MLDRPNSKAAWEARAGLLKPRDAFDLAAAFRAQPEAALRAVAASAPRRAEKVRRLRSLARLPASSHAADIVAIGNFTELLPNLFADALAIIEGAPL